MPKCKKQTLGDRAEVWLVNPQVQCISFNCLCQFCQSTVGTEICLVYTLPSRRGCLPVLVHFRAIFAFSFNATYITIQIRSLPRKISAPVSLIEKKEKEDSCWVESVKSFIMVVGGGGEGGEEGVRSRPRGLLLWRLWSCLAGWVGIIKPLQPLTEWVTVGHS